MRIFLGGFVWCSERCGFRIKATANEGQAFGFNCGWNKTERFAGFFLEIYPFFAIFKQFWMSNILFQIEVEHFVFLGMGWSQPIYQSGA